MKQSISLSRIFLLASLALAGCQQEVMTELSDSGLLLSLTDEQVEVTRSTPAELGKPLATLFNVKIEKESGQVIYDDLFTEKPIPASAGKYTLTATYGENPVLAWDAPYYKGTASAEVIKGLAKVTIPCKVANALLSVSFTNQAVFDDVYSAYGVKVENGSQSLLITAALSAQSAYFQTGSTLKVTFEGTLKEGEQAVTFDLTESLQAYLPLQAGDHAKIALRASNATLKVEKVEVVKETITENIPSNWLPKPKVNGFANGETTLSYVETNDAIPAAIQFTASTPIQDAEFTLNLEDEHLKQLNGTYQLSTLSQEQRTELESYGIALPILQTKEGELDLTHLTARLQTNAGTTTRNKVSLRIKANDRWSAEQGAATEYTIETVKPEFTVSVQPGNIWTKEFTVDALTQDNVVEGKGNYTQLSQQMSYQFSKDQQTWETLSDDLRKSGLQPNTTYYIRGLYRGAVEGSVTEMKTYPIIVLENGNMEEWHETDGNGHYNLWNPYLKENNNPIWSTKNTETTVNENFSYCSTSGTVQTKNKHGDNYAALIRTVGYGVGNTYAGSLSIIYKKAIGELFLGSYSSQADYGIDYSSNPTGLSFYYQYLPHETDNGICIIELLSKTEQEEVVISRQETALASQSSYIQKTIPIKLNRTDLPINRISVIFKSGTHTNVKKAQKRDGIKEHFGSQLFIDDVELIYDK